MNCHYFFCAFYCFELIDFDRFICFYLPVSLIAIRLPCFNKLELKVELITLCFHEPTTKTVTKYVGNRQCANVCPNYGISKGACPTGNRHIFRGILSLVILSGGHFARVLCPGFDQADSLCVKNGRENAELRELSSWNY